MERGDQYKSCALTSFERDEELGKTKGMRASLKGGREPARAMGNFIFKSLGFDASTSNLPELGEPRSTDIAAETSLLQPKEERRGSQVMSSYGM